MSHDGDDEIDFDRCANCKRLIYHDAEQCTYCGHYVLLDDEFPEDDRAKPSRPPWVVLTAVVLLVLIIWGAIR